MGALLQAKLATMTGRRTVPNVLVNGKSIGGGDDVAELDETKSLARTIQAMAGKQMQKIQERTT
jgi:glutaredoxin-related protein